MTGWPAGFWLGVAVLAFLCGGGCGYHLQGRGTPEYPEIRAVAIPVFGNRTVQTGIESEVTRALVEKFSSSGRIGLASRKAADALVLGTVKSFATTSVTVTSGTQVTTGYRAALTVEVAFQRAGDGKTLWKEEITEWRNYAVVSDLAATENNKREAVRRISERLAERIQERVLGGF
jgi:outer membrane lipopolysaccharide assembly protein LptE/RlpB